MRSGSRAASNSRGAAGPAAFFEYSASRHGEHPVRHLAGWAGVMQADAFAGFNELYDGKRRPGPILEAACWAHGQRKFFALAKLAKAPIAIEAVRRIDLKLFIDAQACTSVPSTERWSVLSSPFTCGCSRMAFRNLTAMSPSSRRPRFFEKVE